MAVSAPERGASISASSRSPAERYALIVPALCRALGDDYASRDDQLERLLHGHVEWDGVLLGHEDVPPGGGIGCRRHEDVDHALLGAFLDFTLRHTRDEPQGVDALTRILDHDDLAEVSRLLREDRLGELPGGTVDSAHDRNPSDCPIPQPLETAADDVGHENPNAADNQESEKRPDPRNVYGRYWFGWSPPGRKLRVRSMSRITASRTQMVITRGRNARRPRRK